MKRADRHRRAHGGRVVRVLALSMAGLALATAARAGGGSAALPPPGGSDMTGRMMLLAIQLGVILFAAKVGSGLFQKLRLPGVIGEIVVGMLVGPYLLGAVALPGLPRGIFPLGAAFPVSAELYGFCSVAAILLLFQAGLETDVSLFMRYSLAGSLVGLGGVAASFAIGNLSAVWLSRWLWPVPLGVLSPAALFLGVMSTATSVGITARILSMKRRIDSPEGATILAGAVLDDVLGIVLLAVTIGMITASRETGTVDWGRLGIMSAKAVAFWLATTALGLAASHRISVLLKLFKDRRTIAIMALGMSLILGGLFEQAGLAMIIGAYVTGLSLSRTDISQLIRERLEPLALFLVPVFFVVMGMLVDVRLMLSPPVWVFGAFYTLAAVVAKIGGCAAPALACGFNLRGAARIGAGMLPRGEVALMVAGIGLATGAIGKEVFGAGVLMTLVTTLVAPPLLLALLRSDADGLRRPAPVRRAQPMAFPFPSPDAADVVTAKIRDVFEDDGFFVYSLHRGEGLYQMRKDAAVVTLRREGSTLVFEANDRDRAFVHAAVLEVVSDLRRMAAELAKPIDRAVMLEDTVATAPVSTAALALASRVDPAVLTPALEGLNKSAIIDELVRLAGRSGMVRDPADARAAVLAREQTGSTGMQHGLALPHGKTEAVDQIVCAIGLKPEGIDFDSLDGEPSRIFVLVLSPKDATGPHIRFLATVGQLLNEEGRAALLRCRSPEAMYACLTGRGEPAAAGAGPAADHAS